MSVADRPAPWHLWVVGFVALAWNGFGATDYTMTQLGNRNWFASMGLDEAQTEAMLAYMETYPMWADALWAIGVWGGLLGAILLLLRSRMAVAAFAASLLGAVVSFATTVSREVPRELAEMNNNSVMYLVLAIAIFLLWYSWKARKDGVLN